ncbi:uncharacterized protein LOC111898439 [Lactuca sativa]|uniref:uncharacterized protein LOC111898439 n=1 Tax=Lactuca sativa TaxID=4236 RepID=UPI0022AEE7BC|nr:uncharacterized protein LOC111898439 [Lactuca sativa]
MYIAVALDGNHEPLLIAFALGTINCDNSWLWFMRRLKDCFDDNTEFGFISHMSDSIDFAFHRVYADSYHDYCCKNIAEKIRASIGSNTVVEQLFWKTCKVYNLSQFYACLNNLKNEVNGNDLHWLDNIPIAKWVRACFPRVRFNVKFIDILDVVNWFKTNTHEFPTTTTIEMVHDSMQAVCLRRAAFGVDFTGDFHNLLTLYALKVIHKRFIHSDGCRTTHIVGDRYEVTKYSTTEYVQLDRSICSCGKWQKCGIPCEHAIASLHRLEIAEIHQMVNLKLSTVAYRNAYQTETVNPIPTLRYWEKPVESVVVLPPRQFN